VIWLNCFGVTVANCPSNAMSQSWPYRPGGSQRPDRDLTDDEQPGQREGEREQREGHRLRADRALDGRDLRRLVGDEHLAAGGGVTLSEFLRLLGDPGERRTGLQPQVRAVEAVVTGAELTVQRRAGPDLRHPVQVGHGYHRGAAHEHADDMLSERANMVRVVYRGHRQHAADVQVHPLRADLVDRDLPRGVRPWHAAGEHLRDVERAGVAAVERGGNHGAIVQRTAPGHWLRVDAHHRGGGGHAWQRGDRGVVAGGAVSGGRDQHARGA
jgi:hypothetical protein